MGLTARVLLLICVTSGYWAFSFGLGTQTVTHFLKAEGCSDTVIGLAHSFYYFGVAAGSCAVPWLTRRFGPVRCAAIGMVGAGLTLAAFPLAWEPWGWCLLRFVNGLAGAMSLVPLETIVSRDSPPERKTSNFAYYGVSLTLGGALGIGVGWNAFLLGPCLPIGAAVLLRGVQAATARPDAPGVSFAWARNFLSYGTAWVQGFLEGGMVAFLALFLISRGFTSDAAGILMGVTMVGVIVFQVPVAWLADRWGTSAMLLRCYGVVALGLVAIPFLTDSLLLAATLFAFGACTGAMYPLGLSLLGDNVPASALPRAYAWYLAIECVGSQVGAAAMGHARDAWGEGAMFGVGFAALVVVMAAWLGMRYWLRDRMKEAARDQQRIAA